MSEITCNTNKCNWSNSFSVNGLGTLDNVLECETCGKRDYETNRQPPIISSYPPKHNAG